MATTAKTRTDSGITPYTGTWDRAAVIHLLRRVHFGVKKSDVDYFLTKSMSQAIDEILTIDHTDPSPPINNYDENNPDPTIAAGQTWVNDYNGKLNNVRMGSFKMWWTGQIINHDRTIREKLVLFWHNHFSTQARVYNWPNFAYTHTKLLRDNCDKNFKSLTKSITLDPAMLVFLNGERNTKTAPDENYSRELQELFTLGKGPGSQYLEADVIAGAKVLTGWRINKTTGAVYFQENRHDTTDKTFSSFYNDTTITGQSGDNGANEVDDLLDMVFAQQEVAKHLVRKFYRWFVYYDIDETTETDVIAPLADIFRNNNYEIKPMLTALLKSEHFFDTANRAALIKNPIDFMHGMARTYDIPFPPATDYVNQYRAWYYISYYAAIQQQELGDPPSVAGWPAYYQIPQFHEIWINSDTLPKRSIISDVLVTRGINVDTHKVVIDHVAFAKHFDNPSNVNLLIDDILQLVHTLDVEQAQKDYMKSILLSGQLNDSYWTDAWNDHIANPSNDAKKNILTTRLSAFIKYIMNLSEYQLS